jgi:hypothetical protein
MSLLELDPTKLCEWIEENAKYQLRKGEVHLSFEPAAAHLHAHRCGAGPADEQQCAAIRAVVALEMTIRQLRTLSAVRPMLEELRDTRKELDARIATLEKMVPRHWHAIPVSEQSTNPVAKVVESASHALESLKRARDEVAAALDRHVLSPEVLKARGSDRPALVSVEGELLENDLFTPTEVSVLIRDCRSPADPVGAVRSRRNNPAHYLQISVREAEQMQVVDDASEGADEDAESEPR